MWLEEGYGGMEGQGEEVESYTEAVVSPAHQSVGSLEECR